MPLTDASPSACIGQWSGIPDSAPFLAELRGLRLKVLVRQLDVNDYALTVSMAERDARIADIYRDLLMVLISEPAVEGIVQWGLTDRATPGSILWLRGVYKAYSGPCHLIILFKPNLHLDRSVLF
jgi:GH35 family endo-1,4-beta-xylanase